MLSFFALLLVCTVYPVYAEPSQTDCNKGALIVPANKAMPGSVTIFKEATYINKKPNLKRFKPIEEKSIKIISICICSPHAMSGGVGGINKSLE